jgi:hypothetical protein
MSQARSVHSIDLQDFPSGVVTVIDSETVTPVDWSTPARRRYPLPHCFGVVHVQ